MANAIQYNGQCVSVSHSVSLPDKISGAIQVGTSAANPSTALTLVCRKACAEKRYTATTEGSGLFTITIPSADEDFFRSYMHQLWFVLKADGTVVNDFTDGTATGVEGISVIIYPDCSDNSGGATLTFKSIETCNC